MQQLPPTALSTVVGGTSTNDQITQQLTALQTSLSSLSNNNNNNNNNSSSSTMTMMMMAMAMRGQQSTVVAAPAAAPVAAAPVAAGPVVNINTRVRHF